MPDHATEGLADPIVPMMEIVFPALAPHRHEGTQHVRLAGKNVEGPDEAAWVEFMATPTSAPGPGSLLPFGDQDE